MAKYEFQQGPSLRQVAAILQKYSSVDDAIDLARRVVCNIVLGNSDAHAKNLSLLHYPDGLIKLAPGYDLLSTVALGNISERGVSLSASARMGQFVNGVQNINSVTAADIAVEVSSWGNLNTQVSMGLVSETISNLQAAASEVDGSPAVLSVVRQRCASLLRSDPAGGVSPR
ncbi:HipA domain-containing protein [Nakamurella antarctica]|uniref:HipA domain-containing protein n=2 Tax=Nakamurella antarctica TaxID=1902245 RepID=A0A3G8ZIJ7_9ACTN|nr:HipA domain-containing protein [Nakamurella antarctica]